jgi:hypothetical protein
MNTTKLRPGDLVEVKDPDEILETLDSDGTLDHLPFMPEMLEFCGKRFRLANRAVKTCFTGPAAPIRTFRGDDVVTLEQVRCSGASHDGCQKECLIFWREAWLRKVGDNTVDKPVDPQASERLRSRLKVSTGPKNYFCQASELLRVTEDLTRGQKFGLCFSEVRAGNCSALQMAGRIATWLFWRTRRKLLGEYGRGSQKTPSKVASLNLQPGEWIEVKSLAKISETLNQRARNSGLYFTPGMSSECGRQYRVKSRLEKIIDDGTGEMRQMRNTVLLEGSLCECAYGVLGGCPRAEFNYWRDSWLSRTTPKSENVSAARTEQG